MVKKVKPERVAILGPHGTFTEEAFLSQPDLAGAETLLCPTISDVLSTVEEGVADLGFVALENSIEGGINVTLDTLAFGSNLLIQREVVMPIGLHLFGLSGAKLGKLEQIVSFPQAIAQCRGWLTKNLKDAVARPADSTASAVRMVAEGGDIQIGAIGTLRAGELHQLELLAKNVADHPDNQTRFVVVGRDRIPPSTGHDKTSVVVYQHTNRPGGLLTILQEFAARTIDLSRLESRPTKQGLGDYCFIMDFAGHIEDEMVADCLLNIRSKHANIKFLGSYPAAGEGAGQVREDRGKLWSENKDWLEELRGKIS